MLNPDYYYRSVLDIDLESLAAKGVKTLLIDLDNTLLARDSDVIPDDIKAWTDGLEAKGFRACLVSNNWHERVSLVAQELGFDLVAKAVKPLPFAFMVALKRMGATRPPVSHHRGPDVHRRPRRQDVGHHNGTHRASLFCRFTSYALPAQDRARAAGRPHPAAVDSQQATTFSEGLARMVRITGTTQLAGVIGWPIEHSLSPAMHNAVYEELGLDWAYIPLPVADEIGSASRRRSHPRVAVRRLQRDHAVQGTRAWSCAMKSRWRQAWRARSTPFTASTDGSSATTPTVAGCSSRCPRTPASRRRASASCCLEPGVPQARPSSHSSSAEPRASTS